MHNLHKSDLALAVDYACIVSASIVLY